jgi:hypothetical protein
MSWPSVRAGRPYHAEVEDALEQRRIRITAGSEEITALLNDSGTADLVWAALPLEALASTWGDEIYFRTAVEADEENGREVVDYGDVGFWPPGQALCLFFGPTPASQGDEIRPASAVNVVGRMEGDPSVLKRVGPGSKVVVERQ